MIPRRARVRRRGAPILALICCVLSGGAALGSDGIPLKITNDTSNNLVVTVYDMNVSPEQPVISNETIYGFASLSIRVSPDSRGYGHVRWTATGGDASTRTCGHKERDQLSAESVLHVSVNSGCNAG
jgi:hypothetical protein